MRDKQAPAIDELLDMDPASFAAAMQEQPEGVQAAVRSELERRIEAIDTAAWGVNRRIRGHNRMFQDAKFDYEQLDRMQQWLAAQFHDTFNTMYADAAAAAAKCWAYEQRNGTAQTARILKTSPTLFGPLRGWNVLGFKSVARKKALTRAHNFDFAAYREVFTMATQTGKNLLDALKETANVARA